MLDIITAPQIIALLAGAFMLIFLVSLCAYIIEKKHGRKAVEPHRPKEREAVRMDYQFFSGRKPRRTYHRFDF